MDVNHVSFSFSIYSYTQAEKRAHHNALERKRRDVSIAIKFSSSRQLINGNRVSLLIPAHKR